MPHHLMDTIAGWESFYVILGSSAAALTGLMFVVISLAGDRKDRLPASVATVRAFGTPIIVHFGAVLLVAALLTAPIHTRTTLSFGLAGCSVAGLLFVRWVSIQARKQQEYQPVDEDWEWHVTLPAVVYGALAVSALGVWWRPVLALTLVGVASLFLLFIGIRNAWDSAVYLSVGSSGEPPKPPTT